MYSYRIGSRDELIPNGALDTGGRFPFAITGDPRGRMLYVTNFLSGTVCPDGRFLYVVHGFPADTVPDVLITFPINANGTLGARRTARSSTSSARRVHANAIAG